ncbi:MAG TPA: hypothetical protein VNW99_08255 [Cytophagaceae bacterium]|jgi:hypothetical protein|nr:hypothetical protein [Cytophagaceae bacterium]
MLENSLNAKESKGLSFEKCKVILNKNGKKYTDEQVRKIRDILYIIGKLDYTIYQTIVKTEKV